MRTIEGGFGIGRLDRLVILGVVAGLIMAALPLSMAQGTWKSDSDYMRGQHSWAYAWVGAWIDPGTGQFILPAEHAANSGADPGYIHYWDYDTYDSPYYCYTLTLSYIYYSGQGWQLDAAALAEITPS